MKKIIAGFIMPLISSVALADVCPLASDIIVKNGNNYDVVAPPGWEIVYNNKLPKIREMAFAGLVIWGDHTKQKDSVRCQYQRDNFDFRIILKSVAEYDEAQVKFHKNWSNLPEDGLYHICITNSFNVRDCLFG